MKVYLSQIFGFIFSNITELQWIPYKPDVWIQYKHKCACFWWTSYLKDTYAYVCVYIHIWKTCVLMTKN